MENEMKVKKKDLFIDNLIFELNSYKNNQDYNLLNILLKVNRTLKNFASDFYTDRYGLNVVYNNLELLNAYIENNKLTDDYESFLWDIVRDDLDSYYYSVTDFILAQEYAINGIIEIADEYSLDDSTKIFKSIVYDELMKSIEEEAENFIDKLEKEKANLAAIYSLLEENGYELDENHSLIYKELKEEYNYYLDIDEMEI